MTKHECISIRLMPLGGGRFRHHFLSAIDPAQSGAGAHISEGDTWDNGLSIYTRTENRRWRWVQDHANYRPSLATRIGRVAKAIGIWLGATEHPGAHEARWGLDMDRH